MHAGMVAAERTNVRPTGVPTRSTLQSVVKELEAAKRFLNSVVLIEGLRLSEDARYELTAAEGLIAGALKKVDAAVRS